MLIVLTVLNPLFAMLAVADSYDERRVRTGARLFRSLLAADTGLEKKLDPKQRLQIWIYSRDARLGQQISELLAPSADPGQALIRGLKLQIKVVSVLPTATERGRPVGLFLASAPANAELPGLVGWGVNAGTIVFSPFEGHVELGITAGLAIEAKVQPYLNSRTVTATGLMLKPFFLKVAKVYP